MSEPLARTTWNEWTCSAEGSPARTSVSPDAEPALKAHVPASGLSLTDSLASYDPASSSWKTCQPSLLGDSDAFSETWPRAGMTRNGIAFPRRPLAPLTRGTESGLLPTPARTDYKSEVMSPVLVLRRKTESSRGVRLTEWLHRRSVPTPNAGNSHSGGRLDELGGSGNPFRGTEIGRLPLNPCWVEEVMGYPIGWTDLRDSETPSCQTSRNGSGAD